MVKHGEVVKANGHVRMVGPERFLADREGALEERLRLGIAALIVVEHG